MKSTNGKTYEQIYGLKKAKELRELRSKMAKKQMAIQRKGKTWKELYGEDRAKEMKEKRVFDSTGSNNPRFNGGINLFLCKNCSKVFKTNTYFTKNRARKFCSNKCQGEFISIKIKYSCIICNNQFVRKRSWKNARFCSMKCRNIYCIGEHNPNWKGGISFEPYSLDWTKELRDSIRKRDNYTCQVCGISEEVHKKEFGRILTVHHVDYNKQNCTGTNLVTVCVKCNSMVNGYRDYWYAYFSYILGDLCK